MLLQFLCSIVICWLQKKKESHGESLAAGEPAGALLRRAGARGGVVRAGAASAYTSLMAQAMAPTAAAPRAVLHIGAGDPDHAVQP